MYYCLTTIKKEIKKPFSHVTKEDIKKLFQWMNDKGYKASTHEKYRVILTNEDILFLVYNFIVSII